MAVWATLLFPVYRKENRRFYLENLLAERQRSGRRQKELQKQFNMTDRLKPLSNKYSPLRQSDMDTLEAFVFFIGWQRSGHSIIGSLLDGHPDVVIAHEFLLFEHLKEYTGKKRFSEFRTRLGEFRTRLFNQLAANSFRHSRFGDRSVLHNEKGYNLKVPGAWQGCFRRLKIIGDKAAGEVTNAYRRNVTNFIHYLQNLKSLVRLPLKVIHVVRNPYDMIATLSLYRGSGIPDVKVRATTDKKYNNQAVIMGSADTILSKAHYLHMMEEEGYDWDVIRIHSEDFIRDPTLTMRELCKFLNLECSENYLQLCANKTFKSTSKSRELIEWDPLIMSEVEKSIREIPFFSHYSFDSD